MKNVENSAFSILIGMICGMDRRLMERLDGWRVSPGRKPLVLRGVRQCGKTWLLRQFAARSFAQEIYLNFEKESGLAGLFTPDMDPHRIIRDLSVLRGVTIDPASTLIIMDEVQECPEALTSLKYFCEDAPEFAVAAAGSLLGLAERGGTSFPVGKVDFLDLGPLTFEEFLEVSGESALVGYLGSLAPGRAVSPVLAAKAESLLKTYLMVGGMPEVVDAWLANQDITKVEEIQQAILDSYALDMAKHAGRVTFPKLVAVWRSIPQQLAKENAKFMFSRAMKGARAPDLEDALEWLLAAGIAIKVPRVSRPELPLTTYADDAYFKLYLADVGLLRRLAGYPASVIVEPSPGIQHFRGALTENYVLTELLANKVRPFFWRSDNTAEIDFVVQAGSQVVPIDVKSGTNSQSRSMSVYKAKYDPAVALKVSLKPTVNGHLPLYAVWSLAQYVRRLLP